MSVARAKPRQQSRQRRLQHHEQARSRPPRQRHQPTVQSRIRPVSATLPPRWLATAGRGRSAGSSICSGRSASAAVQNSSCRDSALEASPSCAQHRLLPQRVVGVLHRQRPQPRCHRLAPRPVQRRKVPRQRTERPAVAGDVVQQTTRTCSGARAPSPPLQISRATSPAVPAPPPSSNRCARSGSSPDRSKPRPTAAESAADSPASSTAVTSSRRPRRRRRKDQLPRHPEMLREHRPQALVPLNQIRQRLLQRRPVRALPSAAPQAGSHSCRQAARRQAGLAPALQPLQEPQPALRIGQRNLRRPQHRHAAAPATPAPQTTAATPAPPRSAPRTGCGSKPPPPAPHGSG